MRERLPILLLPAILLMIQPLKAQKPPDWENPLVFQRNQTSPHATLMSYGSLEQALEAERGSSDYYFSLSGTWKFKWSENLEAAPNNFYSKGYSVKAWDDIRVPSNWQMEGYGHPIFRNVAHAFPADPPNVPKEFNPVGSYVRTFELPKGWKGRQVLLHFEGIGSASWVWINGQEVGYNQGTTEPAEYDITEFLNPGTNRIAVKVLRYSDGTYLECQDMWRLSGIFRDVYLMAVPKVHLFDFYVKTDFDWRFTDATLSVRFRIHNYTEDPLDGYGIRFQLYDDKKEPVMDQPLSGMTHPDPYHNRASLTLNRTIHHPEKWSAEKPYLYTMIMELTDPEGKVTEIVSTKMGFREVEVKNQSVYVNGIAVKLNGMNSHMQHPETGHMMDEETMRKDLILMKKFNINCVRTSHYPPNVRYLELADELGMYIIDEVNDESHASTWLSDERIWKQQFDDRSRRMVHRDKNHPSILFWSAGNESGDGANICSVITVGKQIDKTRPWIYGGKSCEDIVGPRYPFIMDYRKNYGDVTEEEDPRPSFMDEYLAATGNSLGGLDEYWNLIRQNPRLTGGAIWDWVSPGIKAREQALLDDSPNDIPCNLFGKSKLEEGVYGQALSLSGHDAWVEIYRDPLIDITGKELTLSAWIKPDKWNGCGTLLSKGNYHFGLIQPDENTLEFYVSGMKGSSLEKAGVTNKVPENWVGNWHHVAGIYNGESLKLFIDGEEVGSRSFSLRLKSTQFPVCLGKNVEIHDDDHRGKLSNASFDRVAIFNRVISIDSLSGDYPALRDKALLWLDFEGIEEGDKFYTLGIGARSYGVVWPDRSVQPELWQLKKSGQPVEFLAMDLEEGLLRIHNHHHFTALDELDVAWKLSADGDVVDKGKIDVNLPPQESIELKIPLEKPRLLPGVHYWLEIGVFLNEHKEWAQAGHEIAWEQFKMPWYLEEEKMTKDMPPINVLEGDDDVIFMGENFIYYFSKQTGFLESMAYEETQLLRESPKVNIWRAVLANEMDHWGAWRTRLGYENEAMGRQLANGWYATGLNALNHEIEKIQVKPNGDSKVQVIVESTYANKGYRTGFDVTYTYTVSGDGTLELHMEVRPQGQFTSWIPKMGLQMDLPGDFKQFKWYGRGPQENYPDRKTGYKVGLYTSNVETEYVPYLIPQDYGNKTDVYWASLNNDKGVGIKVKASQKFNVSVQKYSTDNLERARYPFQLIERESITLNLDHQVSGVGGTAISVMNNYRTLPGHYSFDFSITPFLLKNGF